MRRLFHGTETAVASHGTCQKEAPDVVEAESLLPLVLYRYLAVSPPRIHVYMYSVTTGNAYHQFVSFRMGLTEDAKFHLVLSKLPGDYYYS